MYELEKEGIYLLVVHVAAISNTQPVTASVHVEMRANTGGFLSVTDWPLLPFYGVGLRSDSFYMTRPPDNVWSLCDAGTRLADCVRDALEGHSQDSVLDRYVLNRPRKHLMLFFCQAG